MSKNLTVILALHNYEITRLTGPDNVKIILRDYELYEKYGDDGCTDFKKDEDGDYYMETEV